MSEVAEDLGISRQGVHDMIKRCNKTLEEYEQKLHLVEKFLNIRAQVKQIRVACPGSIIPKKLQIFPMRF